MKVAIIRLLGPGIDGVGAVRIEDAAVVAGNDDQGVLGQIQSVKRFEDYQVAPAYVLERDCQNFREVYDILHPLQPMDSPRNVRLSRVVARSPRMPKPVILSSSSTSSR